jgi:hypothetical protein
MDQPRAGLSDSLGSASDERSLPPFCQQTPTLELVCALSWLAYRGEVRVKVNTNHAGVSSPHKWSLWARMNVG